MFENLNVFPTGTLETLANATGSFWHAFEPWIFISVGFIIFTALIVLLVGRISGAKIESLEYDDYGEEDDDDGEDDDFSI